MMKRFILALIAIVSLSDFSIAQTNTFPSSGNAGIGTTSPTAPLDITKDVTGSSTEPSIRNVPTIKSDVTTNYYGYYSLPSTQATSFTLSQLRHFQAVNVTKGAGSTVSAQYGFHCADLSSGTNNYGFGSNVSSGTNKFNIYSYGTADNYFNGNVGIGTTSPNYMLDVERDQNASTSIRVINNDTGTAANSAIVIGPVYRQVSLGSYSQNYAAVSNWKNSGLLSTDSQLSNGLVLRSATGNIRFQPTGTSDKIVFDSVGNIGVGTTTPEKDIHIYRDGSEAQLKIQTVNSGNARLAIVDATGDAAVIDMSGTSSYVGNGTNFGTFGINVPTPLTINSGAGQFASVTPVMEVRGGNTTEAYSEVMVMRHSGKSANAVQRELGFLFKLSNETTTGETSKTGGMILESASAWANSPKLHIIRGGTKQMTFDIGGKVGIGTTAPTTNLTVNGGEDASIGLEDVNNNLRSEFFIDASAGVYKTGIRTSNYWLDFDASGPSQNAIRFYTGTGSVGTGTERMRIASDGKIGIGTQSPTGKLDIKVASSETDDHLYFTDGDYKIGTIRPTSSNDGKGLAIAGYTQNEDLTSRPALVIKGYAKDISPNGGMDAAISIRGYNINTSGNLGNLPIFEVLNGHTVSYFMVAANGNVGIGTTTPLAKLSVDGDIRTNEVKVMADISVPDYVFADDYELRSLEETNEYIQENKHLPEIPSATEIGEDGFNVGEMNMLLLKKVEELTLYQIQLLEELKAQKKRIIALEKGQK